MYNDVKNGAEEMWRKTYEVVTVNFRQNKQTDFNKKAVLSQRWPRDARYHRALYK